MIGTDLFNGKGRLASIGSDRDPRAATIRSPLAASAMVGGRYDRHCIER
jgi:hypothetical protein